MAKKIPKKDLACGVKKRKHDTEKGKADTNYTYCYKKKPEKKPEKKPAKKAVKRVTFTPRRSARLQKKNQPKKPQPKAPALTERTAPDEYGIVRKHAKRVSEFSADKEGGFAYNTGQAHYHLQTLERSNKETGYAGFLTQYNVITKNKPTWNRGSGDRNPHDNSGGDYHPKYSVDPIPGIYFRKHEQGNYAEKRKNKKHPKHGKGFNIRHYNSPSTYLGMV